jgi:ABC-2 type transport system permease protein
VNGIVRSSALHFAMHLPRTLRARRTWIVLALVLVPAVIAWLAGRLNDRNSPGEIAVGVGWVLVIGVVVPLSALVLGSSVIAEEVEDRTLTYLTTRPAPRAALLLGRFAAIALVHAALLTLCVGLFLFASARATGPGPVLDAGIGPPLLAAALAGGLSYGALAAALGCFVKNPIVVGLGYAFAVEGFLANLPGKNQLLTVQHHLRSLIAAHGSATWSDAEGFVSAAFVPGPTAATVLAAIVLVALALGAWRLSRREFVLAS